MNKDTFQKRIQFDVTERTVEESDNSVFDIARENFGLPLLSPTSDRRYDDDSCCLMAAVRRCLAGASWRAQQRTRLDASTVEAYRQSVDVVGDKACLISNDLYDDYNSLDVSETSLLDDSERSCVVEAQAHDTEEDENDEPPAVKKYQLNDFERHCILGAGQFGQVWLVSEKARSAKVADPTAVYALKVHAKYELITSDEVETILREKQIMQQLNGHPFIVQLHAAFQDDNLVYMLQEFCQGGELFSVLHHAVDGCLSESQAAFYTLCIADALLYMHSAPHGIVYRDLKPENIMLDATGYPKLIDMGYAKPLTAKTDYQTFTFCGTPRYLAPETVTSAGSSFGVDHWALGVLLYEMVVGESPFYWEGIDEPSLFAAISEEEYPAPPTTVSSEAANLIAQLLVKDPRQRLGRASGTDILRHGWFAGMDLAAMRRKSVPAPWLPTVHGVLDSGCFDDWSDELEDRVTLKYPALMKKESALFDSF
jgi:protein kinase A